MMDIPVTGMRIRADRFVDVEGDIKLAQSLGMLEVDDGPFPLMSPRLRDILNLELFLFGGLGPPNT